MKPFIQNHYAASMQAVAHPNTRSFFALGPLCQDIMGRLGNILRRAIKITRLPDASDSFHYAVINFQL
ncbi:Splicing Factor 3B Subunit 4 [Manis pentadactyla]|nr:Splicing Factor 3B Subunit 4 [Manis pentadactyla]